MQILAIARFGLPLALSTLAFPVMTHAGCYEDQSNCESACSSDARSSAEQFRGMGRLSGGQAAAVVGLVGMSTSACINQCQREYDDCKDEERSRQAELRRQQEERQRVQAQQQREQQRQQADQQRTLQQQQTQQAQSAQEEKGRRWLAEGYEHYQRKEYKDAIDFFESGLKLAPNNAEGRYYAAMSYLALKQTGEAERHASAYLNLEPDSPYANKLKRALPGLGKVLANAREQENLVAEKTRLEAERRAKEMSTPGKVFRDCPDCPEMVVLPAGSFDMGGSDPLEQPVHSVNLKSFAMGKTEVTQAEWQSVMGSNPSEYKACGSNCPVEQITWDDAQEFIRRLNAKTGKQYRLPSEAEWEYACRSGSRDEYCGGNNPDAVAWHGGNSPPSSTAVARKQANAWGLYDMSGNVAEYTQDCFNKGYSGAPNDGSAWTSGNCSWRVVRGGSFGLVPEYVRSAKRGIAKSDRYPYRGFRLARTLSP